MALTQLTAALTAVQWILLTIAVFSQWLLAVVVYRLFFHKLSSYPGPWPAAASNWFAFFFVARGDLHEQVHKWHQLYGPVIRIGPNSLCFNTDTAYADIYSSRANAYKDKSYAALSVSRRTPNLITSTDRDVAKFKRKVHLSILDQKNVEGLKERWLAKIETFLGVLAAEAQSAPIDMAQEASCLTLEIIADLCFGQSLPFVEDADHRWVLLAIKTMSWRGIMHASQPNFHSLKLERIVMWFLAPHYQSMARLGSWAYASSASRAKQDAGSNKHDFFSTALRAKDTTIGQKFEIKDLWVESVLLLVAGSDTTATTISSTLFHLLHHTEALKRVQVEVRETFRTEEEIVPGPELASCAYLQSCINEAMRMTPAVANFMPRLVGPGGMIVGGCHVAEGTTVGASIFALHRNPEYFECAEEFRPERWMTSPEVALRKARGAFYPFSTGPRMCVGMKLAWAEMTVTLARLLFMFDMRLSNEAPCCAGNPSERACKMEMQAFATAFVKGPFVHLSGRKSNENGWDFNGDT